MRFIVNSLAAKPQSVTEIEAKLAARGVAAKPAARVVANARRLGYLDDAELGGQLARGFRARGYGRRRAAQALHRRGLAAVTEAALDAAYGHVDEASLADAALGTRAVSDAAAQRRAVAFLVRRGFTASTARRVVRARSAGRSEANVTASARAPMSAGLATS